MGVEQSFDRHDHAGGAEAALEGLVAQHLTAWNAYSGGAHRIHFWRTSSGTEVDFVVYGEKVFWAIEVKRSSELSPKDMHGLAAFKEEYPEATCLFVIPGKKRESYRGFPIIPMEEFLLGIIPEQPIFS